jgi:hypothetical protein
MVPRLRNSLSTGLKEISMNAFTTNGDAGWPSKTGEKSGPGRDNNQPRK